MFHPSSSHLSFRQQVIALSQSYPCPRCTPGVLETQGLTETLHCNHCARGFVALRGGRLLYPATQMGWKIAPIFWWDGFRWHWGGTTATTKQLMSIIALSFLPVTAVIFYAVLYGQTLPKWAEPQLLSPIVGLLTMQLIYLLCWDFDFFSKRSPVKPQDEGVKDFR